MGSPGAPFSFSTNDNWLEVTQQGNRLHVSVRTADGQLMSTTGAITIHPKISGAEPERASRTVIVHLDVMPTGPATKSAKAERFQVVPNRLDFPVYQIGGAVPEPEVVAVRQGELASVSVPGASWLKVEPKGNRIVTSLRPDGIAPGLYSAAMKLRSRDGQELELQATLMVKAAPVPTPPAQAAPSQAVKPVAPPATPCAPASSWFGKLYGDVIWSGDLAAGAELTLSADGSPGRIIGGGRFPGVCVTKIDVDPIQVVITQIPKTNQWKVRNAGSAVSGFRMSWKAQQ